MRRGQPRRGRIRGKNISRRPRGGRAAVVLGGWLALGLLRTETVAREYYAGANGFGATLVNVEASLQPAIPPFWSVEIHGEVIEVGKTPPGYISAMILWVAPLTGWVIVMGAG